jgi:hypothetical protein
LSVRIPASQLTLGNLQPLIEAQIANAMGLKYLVTRDKKAGKVIRVIEPMAKVKLGKHEEIIEVWEKDPNVQAFADLLNRALGKPKEQPPDINVTGQVRVPLCALAPGDAPRVLPLLPGSDE